MDTQLPPAPVEDDVASMAGQLQSLQELLSVKEDVFEVLQSRYNAELQKGLDLEVRAHRAEKAHKSVLEQNQQLLDQLAAAQSKENIDG